MDDSVVSISNIFVFIVFVLW